MARPTRFAEAATETIRVRVTPSQKRDLQRIASENDTDVAGVIRDAVDEYAADYRESACFAVQNSTSPVVWHHTKDRA